MYAATGRQTMQYFGYSRILFTLPVYALIVLVAGVGCDRGGNDDAGNSAKTQDPNNLRGLGYAGGAEIDGDEEEGVIFRDPEKSYPGYNLYSVQELSMAELIDETGKVVQAWDHEVPGKWENVELLPNGDLLVVGSEEGGLPADAPPYAIADDRRYVLKMSWDGKVIWKHKLLVHHDIEVTPRGNLATLAFERKLVPSVHHSVKTRDDLLLMLNQRGHMVASRSILDAVRKDKKIFPIRPIRPSRLGGPPWVDLFHSNSIEWMHHEHLVGKHPIYQLGNILVCFRHQDRIAVFNWRDNKVIWAWGMDRIFGPHDAQVLENGNILIFDNGLGREPKYSRGIELDPVKREIVWEFVDDPPTRFYTMTRGSIQRLPNGNTLFAESDKGEAFEVTPEGERVWQFVCAHRIEDGRKRATIVRMKRYDRAFIEPMLSR